MDRRGIITTYEVLFTPLETYGRPVEELSGMVNGNGMLTGLDATGLQEDTAYSFSIRAYSSAGPGPFSNLVIAKTPEDGKTVY